MKSVKSLCIIILTALTLTGCDGTPKYVLSKEKMASLLADLYTAESIVEINRSDYSNDSLRKALKQSVLLAHDVTQEQLDTSFMWYGENLTKYIEVHDRVIEILDKKLADTGRGGGASGGSIAGDSVNAWPRSNFYRINPSSASRVISFAIEPDDNWEKGDSYSWGVKTLNTKHPIKWFIAADYPDGSTEYATNQLQGEGWSRMNLQTDSAAIPTRIYGYMITQPTADEEIYLDSIQLVRKRINIIDYNQRNRQMHIGKPKKSDHADTIKNDAPSPANQLTAQPIKAPRHAKIVHNEPATAR